MPPTAVSSRVRFAVVLFVLFSAFTPAGASAPEVISPNVRISQVYLGGAKLDSTYSCTFVELFNAGDSPVSLVGWSLQTALATGTGSLTFTVHKPLAASIGAYQYALIAGECGTAGLPLPTADAQFAGMTSKPLSGRVALVTNTYRIEIAGDPDIIDYVGYGAANHWEGSGPTPPTSTTTAAVRRDGGCTDTDDNAADFEILPPAPRNSASPAHTCPGPTPDACGDPADHIHEVQAASAASPLAGSTRTIEGVVVGDFQGAAKLSGFFVQEEAADADADPLTSEALFVAEGPASTLDVGAGDRVRVTGVVAEVDGLTTLANITSLAACGSAGLPSPAAVALPASAADLWEHYEGMLVTIPSLLTVTGTDELASLGQVRLMEGDRPWHYTELNDPAVAGFAAFQEGIALRSITLDDGVLIEHPDPIVHPDPGLSAGHTLRVGDTLPTGLAGVVDQGVGGYRVQPVGTVSFTPANGRPSVPALTGANVRVAGVNLGHYFNGDGSGDFTGSLGAGSAGEFMRQRAKLISALLALDTDILGVTGIENDGYGDAGALDDLVDGLNASAPGAYAYVVPGAGVPWGSGAATVAIVYQPARVTPVGSPAKPETGAFTQLPLADHVPMAQTFEEGEWGERLTVVVNDLPQRDGCPASGDDADQGDGQGCWNALRTQAAEALLAWLAADPTGAGDPDFLWVGDANAFAREAPIRTLVAGGYTDLLSLGAGSTAYTVVWDGLSGAGDRGLASAALLPQVIGAEPWHINADEPGALDYNVENKSAAQQAGLYNADPYRAASHDPILIGLALLPDRSDLGGDYGLAWHTGQGALRLGTLWGDQSGGDPDDGVLRGESSWNDGQGEVAVTVTGAPGEYACLHAWLDYTGADPGEGSAHTPDGRWSAAEKVIDGVPLLPGVDQPVTFAIPIGAISSTAVYNMRFRLVPAPDPSVSACTSPSTLQAADASLEPIGRADGGEAEDYTFAPGPLAVRLAAIDAALTPAGILITWETVSEFNNAGFNLYRASSPQGSWTKLNQALIPAVAPGSSEGHAYRWLDPSADPVSTHYYQLEDLALDGARTRHAPIAFVAAEPNAAHLTAIAGSSAPPVALPALAAAFLAVTAALARRRKRK